VASGERNTSAQTVGVHNAFIRMLDEIIICLHGQVYLCPTMMRIVTKGRYFNA
jgi:hypothetical protein